jgi:hypothetical protein
LLLPATLECNTILGVEDVKLIGGQDAGHRSDASSSTTGDDDDTTATTTPPPKKPAPKPSSTKRVIFVTKASFTGNLGGVAGADQKCDTAAKSVSALSSHTFKAWVSDPSSQARSRLTHSTDGYVLTDGTAVADNFDDLTDNSIGAAISLDENGQLLAASSNTVWTGTKADGTSADLNCQSWTSDQLADSGQAGDSTLKTFEWSETSTTSCNGKLHLYCVQDD